MRRDEAIKIVLGMLSEEDLAVCANGKISREAFLHNNRRANFYMFASMGKAASIGLGVALNTEKRVVVLDGDGNVLMNTNNLPLIGYEHPKNFIHVCFDNQVYATTGDQPTLTRRIKLDKIAEAAGYIKTIFTETESGLKKAMDDCFSSKGPSFILCRVSQEQIPRTKIVSYLPEEIANRFSSSIGSKKMNTFTINGKEVGKENTCFIIAEIGLNHNGDAKIAKNLISHAAKAGADCIKLQKRTVEVLATKKVLDAEDNRFPEFGKTYREIREKMELTLEEMKMLKKHAESLGLVFLCTPFDIPAVDFLEELEVDAYKTASHSLTNLPLIEHIAKKGKPIFTSTGMATWDDIRKVSTIYMNNNTPYAILHCVSSYPQKPEESNIRMIQKLQNAFPGVPIGYSGHELGTAITIAAVASGATIIERHFTLDKDMVGFDHKLSVTPEELKYLVKAIRDVSKALVYKEKHITKSEIKTLNKYHSSIISAKPIKKDTVITENMLILKNPGTGLESKYVPQLIGKKAAQNINKDEIIKVDMIADLKLKG